MVIYFSKYDSEKPFYTPFSNGTHYHFVHFERQSLRLLEDKIRAAFKHIDIRLIKINYGTGCPPLYRFDIKFYDQADEAFFQIWSNDGIEICE
jgi:hypothetical protein